MRSGPKHVRHADGSDVLRGQIHGACHVICRIPSTDRNDDVTTNMPVVSDLTPHLPGFCEDTCLSDDQSKQRAQVPVSCPLPGPRRYSLIRFQRVKYSLPNGDILTGMERYLLLNASHTGQDEETLCNRGNSFAKKRPTLHESGSTGDIQISRDVRCSHTH